MQVLDWIVLVGTLALIVLYGIWKTRNVVSDSDNFLSGQRDLPWLTIGLSIMATQASAITFLSTPGQGFSDGMQFAQFYFGLPIAMLFLAYFVLPVYYKLKITTAYEYLEQRFDVRMRTLTAILFLIQRGVAAAISIYAPSIILCAVFGWNLAFTNFIMAVFVVIYTTSGGSAAVSRTQELQMGVILGGLVLAFFMVMKSLPGDIGVTDAWQIAGATGKTQIIDWSFDWNDRYNMWSGLLGATFLFLSYFGTDQSQVGRYLSGKSLKESRFGLLFNGFVKIPMQILVLAVGVMVFVFYQFSAQPLHFNQAQRKMVMQSGQQEAFAALESQNTRIGDEKQLLLAELTQAIDAGDQNKQNEAGAKLREFETQRKQLRFEAKELIYAADPKKDTSIASAKTRNHDAYAQQINKKYKDEDYVFINYVLNHVPVGIIGLLLAMIFCASWSTTASELNALTATSVSDIYRRLVRPGMDDTHYFKVSKWLTIFWGAFIVVFATYADLFDNLIQAVNMVGSIFYGTILGIFFTAFFLKKVSGSAVFYAAIVAEAIVVYLFFMVNRNAFLWYNPLGCGLVMGLSLIFEQVLKVRSSSK